MVATGQFFAAVFSIFAGAAILVIWANFYVSGKINSIFVKKNEMVSHIAAELIVAMILISAGISYFLHIQQYRILLGMGLGGLLYAAVNAVGFYLDRSQKSLSLVLVLTSIITATALLLVYLRI